MWKHFCGRVHSRLISMAVPLKRLFIKLVPGYLHDGTTTVMAHGFEGFEDKVKRANFHDWHFFTDDWRLLNKRPTFLYVCLSVRPPACRLSVYPSVRPLTDQLPVCLFGRPSSLQYVHMYVRPLTFHLSVCLFHLPSHPAERQSACLFVCLSSDQSFSPTVCWSVSPISLSFVNL